MNTWDRYNKLMDRQRKAESMMLVAASLVDEHELPPPTDIGLYSMHWEVTNPVDPEIAFTTTAKLVVSPKNLLPEEKEVGDTLFFCLLENDWVEYTRKPSELPDLIRKMLAGRKVKEKR